MLKADKTKENIEKFESIPNITLDFGKYKGKNIKDIIIDREYIKYLHENAINPDIKTAANTVLNLFYKN